MEFDIAQFERWAAYFYDFCRWMERTGYPQLTKDEQSNLLSVNIHVQKALAELKREGR